VCFLHFLGYVRHRFRFGVGFVCICLGCCKFICRYQCSQLPGKARLQNDVLVLTLNCTVVDEVGDETGTVCVVIRH